MVTVGRNKIERRPLLLIKGKIGDVEINTILQDDWHVRVMGADGDAKNITQLKKGDRLMGCLMQSGGRHVGVSIDETIIEK
ncbi:MAG: 3-dehydroquinate synthase II [Halobacteriota archaeon]